jgi:hypothetical protein
MPELLTTLDIGPQIPCAASYAGTTSRAEDARMMRGGLSGSIVIAIPILGPSFAAICNGFNCILYD